MFVNLAKHKDQLCNGMECGSQCEKRNVNLKYQKIVNRDIARKIQYCIFVW